MTGALAVIWLAAWVGTPIVASSKGRNAFGWFLLGLLFGVFALLLVAILPALRQQPTVVVQQGYGPPAVSGATRSCPNCLSEIPLAATACRYCQRDVGATATP